LAALEPLGREIAVAETETIVALRIRQAAVVVLVALVVLQPETAWRVSAGSVSPIRFLGLRSDTQAAVVAERMESGRPAAQVAAEGQEQPRRAMETMARTELAAAVAVQVCIVMVAKAEKA